MVVHVTVKCAVSVDGYIDDLSRERLILSGPEDKVAVDQLRAKCDAILIGANTLRLDDPALLVKDEGSRRRRLEKGRRPNPIKVLIAGEQVIDRNKKFFSTGDSEKVVYCARHRFSSVSAEIEDRAVVVPAGERRVMIAAVLKDLEERGVERLLVEGGAAIHTEFLAGGYVDELRLAVAPFFVGEEDAPRFVWKGKFPHDGQNRMQLLSLEQVGDVGVLTYRLQRLS